MTVAAGTIEASLTPTSPRRTWARSRFVLPTLLLLGLALRLVALSIPSIHHPDEIFQYLEPAHRLVFGRGVVTWEWRYGMRNWFIPLPVAGLMQFATWIAPQTDLYLLLPKFAMTVVSLITVTTGWHLGARLSSRHAVIGAFVGATWWEFVYFAPHVLSETVSVAFILPAALLLTDRSCWTPRRLAAAGALLALAGVARFQYLPAIATLALCCCAPRLKECWRPLVLGAILALVPAALMDAAMGQVPFAWLFTNIRLNLVANRAAYYGVGGPADYLVDLLVAWHLWIAPIVVLAWFGARRHPALACTALVNIAFHMAIAHKEYRFILLSSTLLILLAAIGSGEVIDWIQRSRDAGTARRISGIVIAGWLLASASLAGAAAQRGDWTRSHADLQFYARLHHDPALCGFAIYRRSLAQSGGYTYLHRPVAIQYFRSSFPALPRAAAEKASLYNTVIVSARDARYLPPTFRPLECKGESDDRVCLYRRPGPCAVDPASPYEINAVLRHFDQ